MATTHVPVDTDGNMISYPRERYERDGVSWRRIRQPLEELPPFDATLRVVDYERGQSAARFTLEDVATGKRYPVFFSTFFKLIEGTEFTGRWEPHKTGRNYGIRKVG